MSITVSTTPGQTTTSEYAAISISFNRAMVPVNNVLTPEYTANINYSKVDYLLDASGNKVSVIQPSPVISTGNNSWGNVNVSSAQLTALSAGLSTSTTSNIIDVIANAADSLIQADLVARGIVSAPAA